MTRRLKHQFATFWFSINDYVPQVPGSEVSEALEARLYDIWNHATKLIAVAQAQHPMYRFQETHAGDMLDFERWEFCDQDGLTETCDKRMIWPVSFYHEKAFSTEVLVALREVCVSGFDQACKDMGAASKFVHLTTTTEYLESETVVVPGV